MCAREEPRKRNGNLTKLKKAEYMSYHLGEEFDGIISGVTGYGLYVELGNTVEGLVHITALKDDYYTFDQETHELRGELTKKVYHLGQKIRVRVADADAVKKVCGFYDRGRAGGISYGEETGNQTDCK